MDLYIDTFRLLLISVKIFQTFVIPEIGWMGKEKESRGT